MSRAREEVGLVEVSGGKNKKYLKHVKTLHCMEVAGDVRHEPVHPHHLRNQPHSRRYVDEGNVVPLCFKCHRWVHDHPAWEREHHETLKHVAMLIWDDYKKKVGK